MQNRDTPPSRVVAVFNGTPDALLMLRVALEHAGFTVVPVLMRDIQDDVPGLEAILRGRSPDVVVYDIAPPYEAQWHALQLLKTTPPLSRCYFILTSTNRPQVDRLAGLDPQVFAIIGTPYDLKDVIQAVHGALEAGLPPSST